MLLIAILCAALSGPSSPSHKKRTGWFVNPVLGGRRGIIETYILLDWYGKQMYRW